MAELMKFGVLGNGSYGTVYLASLIFPGEQDSKVLVVAMKSSSVPFGVASMQKERNILELFMGCEEIIQCYFYQYAFRRGCITYNLFMEYAPYGSLGDLIRKRPLSEKEVIVYTHMLLKGLSCIHKKGVVHCDLKPDNILLFPSFDGHANYRLKIADFGLSRTREEINDDLGEIRFRGTPYYMSPESIVGFMKTPLDIWSLGCIVIEMITRFPAWWDLQTQQDLMWKLAFLSETPKIPGEVSWNCKNFLSKCFVADPKQRWTATMLLHHPFMKKEFPTSPIHLNH